ncbi:MAG TPA: VCBS repeat-containing protein [Phycisphaerae bacterium]|nr:VCBS repeat-containing protein [Phycisphaerae bacterium]
MLARHASRSARSQRPGRRIAGAAHARHLLEPLEPRTLFTAIPYLAIGSLTGGTVKVFNSVTKATVASFQPYSGYTGGVSVALGDTNNDGTPEIITAPTSRGALPLVYVFDLSGNVQHAFFAYSTDFKGGVSVASADFTGDGDADIVTAPGPGGGPHVEVFNGNTYLRVRSFFAFPAAFIGGVNIAVGDVNNDGTPDIIATPRAGGAPVVEVFSGTNGLNILSEFAISDHTFSGGLTVAAGDVNGDGHADVIVATGAGTAANKVVTISGADGSTLSTFTPFTTTAGLNLAAIDSDADGNPDVAVSPLAGGHDVTVFKGTTHVQLDTFNVINGVNLGVYPL